MISNNALINTEAMISSIGALQPSAERSQVDIIAELFPAIQHAMSRGVTAKSIMADLQRNGLKLHPAKFKKLLEQMRALYGENGEALRCPSCGSVRMTRLATEVQPE